MLRGMGRPFAAESGLAAGGVMKWSAIRVAPVLALVLAFAVCAAIGTWAVTSRLGYPSPSLPQAVESAIVQAPAPAPADFGLEQPSPDMRRLAHWILNTSDHAGAPFFIVDKPQARLLVFDGRGRLQGASPVLLGLALGDDSAPGIGLLAVADIRPEDRTTPAGRFIAERGRNLRNEGVVWVDYDAAVSMHRVLTSNPAERRLERLASNSVQDKRISSGCINVPAAFFDAMVYAPVASGAKVIIYVLPDEQPLLAVFPKLHGPLPVASAERGS